MSSFITSERKLDYHHWSFSVLIVSWIVKRIKQACKNYGWTWSGVQSLWSGTHILPSKKNITLQIFSWIGKTMKKLGWTPNTIVNINFDDAYISHGINTDLFAHMLKNNLLSELQQRRVVFKILKTSTMKLYVKIVSNVNLQPLTVIAKMFILCAWLVP